MIVGNLWITVFSSALSVSKAILIRVKCIFWTAGWLSKAPESQEKFSIVQVKEI
jgi:hypothetical protein